MRRQVLLWMDRRQWHLYWPRTYRFWEWVVMPFSWGGRLGFINWIRWVMR
jgi:hypothetical protein